MLLSYDTRVEAIMVVDVTIHSKSFDAYVGKL